MNKCYPTIVIRNCPDGLASEYFDMAIMFAREHNIPILIWYDENNSCISFEANKDNKDELEVLSFYSKHFFGYSLEYSSREKWDRTSRSLMGII